MKKLFLLFLALPLAGLLRAESTPSPAPAPSPTEETTAPATDDAEPKARSAALELAGAFSNDGYKIRDGFYFGDLAPGKPAVIEVNLFAGNEYWFCGAANDPTRKIAVQVFDEDGNLVKDQQLYEDGTKAASGIVAPSSGKFLVRIALAEGDKGQFCFIYCYK